LRLKLIACEIFYREICDVVARSVNQVDIEFLPKGLHDIGQPGMFARLNEVLTAVDESQYDAIVLAYGLCNNGIVGLAARSVPLVVPRGHDCMTLFMGTKERYLEYFQSHPGVYFKTSGWIERGDGLQQFGDETVQGKSGMELTYEEMVEKYGEDKAKFRWEQLGDMTRNYSGVTFIEMGVGPDEQFERQAREEAAEQGWKFEKIVGDMSLIRTMVDGPWDDDRFLVIPAGQKIEPSYDADIIRLG